MAKLFIIAGEESGDLHASNLVRELKLLRPDLEIFGLGGERMKQAGVHLLHDLVAHAVIGFLEVAKNYPYFRRVFYDSLDWIQKNKPDAVILVDYPGFNLRLAKKIHALRIPVIYYISPQVWAWGKKRIPKISQIVTKMLLILPFETLTYAHTSLKTEFVGHPLLDVIKVHKTREQLCLKEKLSEDSPIITLLPGSRRGEIERHLPVILQACKIIKKEIPSAQFVLLLVHNAYRELVEKIIRENKVAVTIMTHEKYDWRAASDLSLVASGTATLEGAIVGTPMVIFYKTSSITYFFAQKLITLPYIGLANVVAGKKNVPELVQKDFTSEKLAAESLLLLRDENKLQQMKVALGEVRDKLGGPGASQRAAKCVLETLSSKKSLKLKNFLDRIWNLRKDKKFIIDFVECRNSVLKRGCNNEMSKNQKT